MTDWTSDELNRVGQAEELDISSVQADGVIGKATTIWVVRVGDDLYVRPVNGRSGAWFLGTQMRHEGHIEADGISKDVVFVEVDPANAINDEIDAAYWEKYPQHSEYVPPVLTPKARAATIRLVPA